ncbi:unnamed protein product, partial [Meganyctiphanes norvegica]
MHLVHKLYAMVLCCGAFVRSYGGPPQPPIAGGGPLPAAGAPGEPRGLEDSPLSEVSALVGGRVLLGCDVSTPDPRDTPILVLFYSGARGTPIYSIDARSGPFGQSVHWSELGTRAHFDVSSSPSGLVIDGVTQEDEGDYRCRVDFRASPTRNARVRLNVVVPPGRVRISTEDGAEVSGVIGPFPVGKPLSLTCTTQGGHPQPRVSWWHSGSLLDDMSEVSTGKVVQNSLSINPLKRHHLYNGFTCQALNSNMSMPMAATVTLDLAFPPLDVSILGSNEALSVGEVYSVVCEAWGSRPPATVTWWKNGEMLTDTKDEVLSEGNVSRSTLHIRPSRDDNNAALSCRADNSQLPQAVIEDTRTLKIYYIPKIQIHVGASLDMTDIEEGDDIYFECNIKANPTVFKVQWFLNGEELKHNQSAGVIQSNQSLVLQRVTRASSGLYTCTATNIEGTGKSNAVQLNVKYLPVCAPGQQLVYGGGKHEAVQVSCRVEAYPVPTMFTWSFNTSTQMVDIPLRRSMFGRSRSTLKYTPQSHHDFGSLLCWAVNEVGRQSEPCHFQVVPAGEPDPVQNCSVLHNSSVTAVGAFMVGCSAGWSGGLTQTFSLEVRHNTNGYILASLRDQVEPNFFVTGLAPGSEYVLAVVAQNTQGTSKPTVFNMHMPIDVAEKQIGAINNSTDSALLLSPLLGILLGVVASLIIFVMVLILVVRSHLSGSKKNNETKIMYEAADTDIKSYDEGGFKKQDVCGPDILLVKPDNEVLAKHKELIHNYMIAKDSSFYINPGSLMNNENVQCGEIEALLPPPPQHQDPVTNFIARSGSGLSPSPLPPPLFMSDYGEHPDIEGRHSPGVSSMNSSQQGSSIISSSFQGSTSTVALHPDYCPHDVGIVSPQTSVINPHSHSLIGDTKES